MSSFLTELGGFTPVLDIVTQDVGLMSSTVYGLVWRHCQMKDGVCKKSVPELAEMIGVDERTVRRHLDKLCEWGYIRDLTPDLKNRPHVYADTGKVKITGKVEATLSHPDQKSGQPRPDRKSPPLALTLSQGHPDSESGPPGLKVRATLTQSPMSKTGKPFKETGETAPAPDFDSIARQAITVYSETAQIKLDRVQAGAITKLIRGTPKFDMFRWQAACTSVRLAGVRPENVQCRIDTYIAGGNYQAMVGRRQDGSAGSAAPKAPALDEAKRQAYLDQLAADQVAIAETNQRINSIVNEASMAGIDVNAQIKKIAQARRV